MNNVVHVDFSKTKARKVLQQEVFGFESDLTAYLNRLRDMGVEEDDILDTLDAINDMDRYFASDEEIQEFANGWLHKFL